MASVVPATDQEEVHHLMSRHSFSMMPAVAEEQRVLGVIRAGEALSAGEEEAAEDMLRMASRWRWWLARCAGCGRAALAWARR